VKSDAEARQTPAARHQTKTKVFFLDVFRLPIGRELLESTATAAVPGIDTSSDSPGPVPRPSPRTGSCWLGSVMCHLDCVTPGY